MPKNDKCYVCAHYLIFITTLRESHVPILQMKRVKQKKNNLPCGIAKIQSQVFACESTRPGLVLGLQSKPSFLPISSYSADWVKGKSKGGETSCRDTRRVVPGAWRELKLWEDHLGKALATPEECPGTAGPSPLTPGPRRLTPLEAGGLGSLPGAALRVGLPGTGHRAT